MAATVVREVGRKQLPFAAAPFAVPLKRTMLVAGGPPVTLGDQLVLVVQAVLATKVLSVVSVPAQV